MKNNSWGALIMALVILCTMLLPGCKSTEATTATTIAETTVPQTATLLTDENGVPYIEEEFGMEDVFYHVNGTATLSLVEDANNADNTECVISERGSNNSGITLPCDEFRCNTINVSAGIKSSNAKVMLTLQYDIFGNTSYVTIADCQPSPISYSKVTGQITIPDNATNVHVYIEAGDVMDITVDYVHISVEGDYIDPATVPLDTLQDPTEYPSLSELYADYFKVGVAIPTTIVSNENEEFTQMINQEYNSITLENEMKPENILDLETSLSDLDTYNECPALDFSGVTETLDWAQENGIVVRGHTLIWYSQTPSWLFYENYDVNGELVDRDLMVTRMENYIKGVFEWINENYPDLFYAYDIVNEAIDDGTCELRDCYWKEIIGDDYVELAFQFARQYAGENIQLCYNDYNEYQEDKQNAIIEMLTPVAEAGNIDVMGMQSHMTSGLSVTSYVDAMNRYADELGVSIQITELDIGAPNSVNAIYDQGMYYYSLFCALIEAVDNGTPLESVTFWGLSDDLSWRSDVTPLLFYGDLSPKTAFEGVVCAITGDEVAIPDDYIVVEADYSPIYEDYEDGSFIGIPRYSSIQEVVTTDAYEGEACLCNSGGSAEYDGYAIDVTRFVGTTINYSFAIRCDADIVHFTADIENEWPWLEEIDTSSGEWIFIEGTYEVPADMTYLQLYFESSDMTEFYLDNLSISIPEDA